jgi:hypothetical protein
VGFECRWFKRFGQAFKAWLLEVRNWDGVWGVAHGLELKRPLEANSCLNESTNFTQSN